MMRRNRVGHDEFKVESMLLVAFYLFAQLSFTYNTEQTFIVLGQNKCIHSTHIFGALEQVLENKIESGKRIKNHCPDSVQDHKGIHQ